MTAEVNAEIAITLENPDQPEVIALIDKLDEFQGGLYPAESNHLLDIKTLCGPDVAFLVARLNGEVVGCGAIKFDDRGWGEVKRMYVDPEVRGKGLGQKLLKGLECIAHERDVFLVRLETGIYSHEALAAYRRAGYRECAAFGDYALDPLSVFMGKSLSGPLPASNPRAAP